MPRAATFAGVARDGEKQQRERRKRHARAQRSHEGDDVVRPDEHVEREVDDHGEQHDRDDSRNEAIVEQDERKAEGQRGDTREHVHVKRALEMLDRSLHGEIAARFRALGDERCQKRTCQQKDQAQRPDDGLAAGEHARDEDHASDGKDDAVQKAAAAHVAAHHQVVPEHEPETREHAAACACRVQDKKRDPHTDIVEDEACRQRGSQRNQSDEKRQAIELQRARTAFAKPGEYGVHAHDGGAKVDELAHVAGGEVHAGRHGREQSEKRDQVQRVEQAVSDDNRQLHEPERFAHDVRGSFLPSTAGHQRACAWDREHTWKTCVCTCLDSSNICPRP